jgi:hypothetical protein
MNISEIALQLNIPEKYFINIALNCDKFYYTYYIKKKSGKNRLIDSPNIELKGLQKWINNNILKKITLPNCVHGFREKHSIRTNAIPHLGRKYVFCLDLLDFFPTIKYIDVQKIFNDINCDEVTSFLLAKLCTFNGYLPQGAVTSPCIANIVFSEVDKNIMKICGKKRVSYTRYADDLTFSSNNRESLLSVIDEVKNIVEKTKFCINKKKSRLMSGQRATIVTGLRLNSNKLSIGNKKKKVLKAKIFDMIINQNTSIEKIIFGEIAYLRSIEPETYLKICSYVKVLETKKQKFNELKEN